VKLNGFRDCIFLVLEVGTALALKLVGVGGLNPPHLGRGKRGSLSQKTNLFFSYGITFFECKVPRPLPEATVEAGILFPCLSRSSSPYPFIQ